jgi:hypothetical protein
MGDEFSGPIDTNVGIRNRILNYSMPLHTDEVPLPRSELSIREAVNRPQKMAI